MTGDYISFKSKSSCQLSDKAMGIFKELATELSKELLSIGCNVHMEITLPIEEERDARRSVTLTVSDVNVYWE